MTTPQGTDGTDRTKGVAGDPRPQPAPLLAESRIHTALQALAPRVDHAVTQMTTGRDAHGYCTDLAVGAQHLLKNRAADVERRRKSS